VNADRFAEAVIAGCAAASRHGCQLAHQRVTVDDFTVRTYRGIFAAAATVPDYPTPSEEQATAWARFHLTGIDPPNIWPSELRLQAIAAQVDGVTVEDLEMLVHLRPVAEDTLGVYAGRVLEAERLRLLERTTVAVHEALRVGDLQRAEQLHAIVGELLEAAA
jgi:hypothetical protein